MSEPGSIRLLVPIPKPDGWQECRHIRAQLYASRGGATVLWETSSAPVWTDAFGTAHIELRFEPMVDSALFRVPIRYLSVDWTGAHGWSARAVVDGTPVLRAVEWARMERRLSALEAAWRAAGELQVLGELRDALDDHERRIQTVEAGAPVRALERSTAALSGRLDRLDRDDGRLVRIEDELEDLVGPRGDVVDFEERLSLLERVVFGRSSLVTDAGNGGVSS